MPIEMKGEASVFVSSPPKDVYALVTDIARMGEWSPECVGAEWINEGGPTVGASFHGQNRRDTNEWTTPNTVIAADEGREFAWVVGTADFRVCTWRYALAPEGDGTRLTESFELGKEEVGFASMVLERPADERPQMIEARRAQLVADMEQTLARLKDVAEANSPRE
jgi:ribosome-associated toxin RatA of RatAB toxin-antitoxin module